MKLTNKIIRSRRFKGAHKPAEKKPGLEAEIFELLHRFNQQPDQQQQPNDSRKEGLHYALSAAMISTPQ